MDAFDLLTSLSNEAEKVITQLMTQPVDVLTTGVIFLAAPLMLIWTIYKAYMIMGGFQEAYFPAFLKDAVIKFVILFIAGSSGYYLSNVSNIVKETPMAMAQDLSGESNVLSIIETKLSLALDQLDKTTEAEEPPDDAYPADFGGDVHRAWDDLWKKVGDAVNTVLEPFKTFIIILKLMVIIAGLLFLAIALMKIILVTKTMWMLSIGFGPLFLMFAAFDKTRGWFNSWLNTTIGYGMSYVVIMFTAKVLLTILDVLWQDGVSWINVFASFFVCIALAVVIGRVGDVASAWFGAGNIADGTAAAAGAAMGIMGHRVKGMAQTVGSNSKDAVRAYKNRGMNKMNRYNTRYAYQRNKQEAAKQNNPQTTSIQQGTK